MGALSFKERFCERVVAGLMGSADVEPKLQSIRHFRSNPLKPGERVALFYAQRSKNSKRLGESVIKSRQIVTITDSKRKTSITVWHEIGNKGRKGGVDLQAFAAKSLDAFAVKDGFEDYADMRNFWMAEHGKQSFPYTGHLYKWYSLAELGELIHKGIYLPVEVLAFINNHKPIVKEPMVVLYGDPNSDEVKASVKKIGNTRDVLIQATTGFDSFNETSR